VNCCWCKEEINEVGRIFFCSDSCSGAFQTLQSKDPVPPVIKKPLDKPKLEKVIRIKPNNWKKEMREAVNEYKNRGVSQVELPHEIMMKITPFNQAILID